MKNPTHFIEVWRHRHKGAETICGKTMPIGALKTVLQNTKRLDAYTICIFLITKK